MVQNFKQWLRCTTVLVGAVSSDTPVIKITARFKRISSEYVKSVKYATQSAGRLRKELKHFRGILEEVEEHLDVKMASAGTGAEIKFLQSFEESLALAQSDKSQQTIGALRS